MTSGGIYAKLVASFAKEALVRHISGAMINLILVNQSDKQSPEDFEEIRSHIAERAHDINVHIVDYKLRHWTLASEISRHPTFTVSPTPIRHFNSPRGPVFQGFEFPKSDQYQRLAKIGIRFPDWQRIESDTKLDPDRWGPYVVVKPELGRNGAEIRVKKTARVKYKPPDLLPDGHPGRKAPMLVQRFVYTGPWACCSRVVTLFGKTLLCWHCEIDHSYPALKSRFGFAEQGGVTIVSNKKSSKYRLGFDADVIAFAEAAHAAFPEQPLLGHDVVRDHESGELFMLECNPRGDTWLFSSYTGTEIQKANGIDFRSQFGGMSRVADILIEEARRRAR